LSRCRGLKQSRSGGFEIERGLNAGFNTPCYENSLKPAVSEPGCIGMECVFTRIERGEAEDPIPG
jgi:hypothetical protein